MNSRWSIFGSYCITLLVVVAYGGEDTEKTDLHIIKIPLFVGVLFTVIAIGIGVGIGRWIIG